jgi:hypothetical protein
MFGKNSAKAPSSILQPLIDAGAGKMSSKKVEGKSRGPL